MNAPASYGATVIVPFEPAHEAACLEVWAGALPDMFRDPPPATRETFLDSTNGESMFVAAVDGSVGGFVSVWDPDRFVHLLVTDRRRRGQGIGGALLDHAVARLGRPAELKCQPHNLSACAFYERRGWVPVEHVSDAAQPYILYRLD